MTKKANSRLTRELVEMADEMRSSGLLTEKAHQKITMRHLGASAGIAPITAREIRVIREKAKLSQAVFAQYLNLTPGYVSQLERGVKSATGAALAMLDVIRRKGMAAIL